MAIRIQHFVLFLALGAALVSCRRPEPGQDSGGPSASSLSMDAEAPAETEVTASSGAVSIKLRAHKTKIKKGGSLWLQLVITNVSSAPLMVRDDDYLTFMGLVAQQYGVSLRVADEQGRDATARLDSLHEGHVPLNCMRPEDRKPWEDWIHGRKRPTSNADLGVVWLDPGESALSASFAYQSGLDRHCARKPRPPAIHPFAEFAQVRALEPGRYRLLLSYNKAPETGDKVYPGDVSFHVPPILFEVSP